MLLCGIEGITAGVLIAVGLSGIKAGFMRMSSNMRKRDALRKPPTGEISEWDK